MKEIFFFVPIPPHENLEKYKKTVNIWKKPYYFILFCQACEVLVPGVLSVQVQGACASDGPIGHLGRAAEQLLLWCVLRPRRNGRLDLRHNQVGSSMRIQQPETARQMGRTEGEYIKNKLQLYLLWEKWVTQPAPLPSLTTIGCSTNGLNWGWVDQTISSLICWDDLRHYHVQQLLAARQMGRT